MRTATISCLLLTLFSAGCGTPSTLYGTWTNVNRVTDAAPGEVLVRIDPDCHGEVEVAEGLFPPFVEDPRRLPFRWRAEGPGRLLVKLRSTGEAAPNTSTRRCCTRWVLITSG